MLAINGEEYKEYNDLINPQYFLSTGTQYTVHRDGEEQVITVKSLRSSSVLHEPFLHVLAPFEIADVEPLSGAECAGLKIGDKIKKVNGISIVSNMELKEECLRDPDNMVVLEIQRGDNEIFERQVSLDKAKRVGILPRLLLNYSTRQFSIRESVWLGTKKFFSSIADQFRGVYTLLGGKLQPRKSAGPIGILQAFVSVTPER